MLGDDDIGFIAGIRFPLLIAVFVFVIVVRSVQEHDDIGIAGFYLYSVVAQVLYALLLRIASDTDGPLFALLGAGMWYWGRVLANAVPQYYIFDPTVVTRRYGSSGDSGSDDDYDSGSDYDDSDYDSGGGSDSGGSFGGGGASGSW